ncbi:MAG: SMP-30/gluconolactonase/LRE family protein [Planctomycetota bacterium]
MKHATLTLTIALLLTTPTHAHPKPQAPTGITHTPLETLATGFRFTEGPALASDGSIYFSDIPNNRIHRYDPATNQTTVALEDSGGANGLMIRGNQLFACRGRAKAVSAYTIKPQGKLNPQPTSQTEGFVTFVTFSNSGTTYRSAPFNGPNDLALDTHGGLYFTDPAYGNKVDPTVRIEGVHYWRFRPEANALPTPNRLITTLKRPNGIALSPDGHTLYVADNHAATIHAYPFLEPGKLGPGKLFLDLAPLGKRFATPDHKRTGGNPDGMALDPQGNLYITLFSQGVLVVTPSAQVLGFIDSGFQTTNCTFAADGKTLYITANKSLLRTKVTLTTTPATQPAD